MRNHATQVGVLLATILLFITTMLPWQSASGSGIARRDAVRSEEQHRQEAIKLAKEAADYSQQGQVGPFLTSAEAAIQHALKAGKEAHLDAGIAELKQAVEHGSAGNADVATKHAEQAVMHLSGK